MGTNVSLLPCTYARCGAPSSNLMWLITLERSIASTLAVTFKWHVVSFSILLLSLSPHTRRLLTPSGRYMPSRHMLTMGASAGSSLGRFYMWHTHQKSLIHYVLDHLGTQTPSTSLYPLLHSHA